MNIGEIKTFGKYKMIWAKCPKCGNERWVYLSTYNRGGRSGQCLQCYNGYASICIHGKKSRLCLICKREKQSIHNRTPKGLYICLKKNAKANNRKVSFTLDEFISWRNSQKLICHYCERFLDTSGRNGDSLTIDRKDNSREYVLDNIVLACHSCNSAKRQMEYGKFKEIVARLKLNNPATERTTRNS